MEGGQNSLALGRRALKTGPTNALSVAGRGGRVNVPDSGAGKRARQARRHYPARLVMHGENQRELGWYGGDLTEKTRAAIWNSPAI